MQWEVAFPGNRCEIVRVKKAEREREREGKAGKSGSSVWGGPGSL